MAIIPMPWIIEEADEDRLRREEQRRKRTSLEVPLSDDPASQIEDGDRNADAQGGVQILEISPRDENAIDL